VSPKAKTNQKNNSTCVRKMAVSEGQYRDWGPSLHAHVGGRERRKTIKLLIRRGKLVRGRVMSTS